MITSLNSIQKKCGKHISIKNIRTALLRFEKMGFLANQSATHNRLITICNWEHYQSQAIADGKATGNQSANDGQTPGKRLAPNKNDENEKNIYIYNRALSAQQIESQRIREANDEALAKWLAEED
jgi:hypothetical protein